MEQFLAYDDLAVLTEGKRIEFLDWMRAHGYHNTCSTVPDGTDCVVDATALLHWLEEHTAREVSIRSGGMTGVFGQRWFAVFFDGGSQWYKMAPTPVHALWAVVLHVLDVTARVTDTRAV